MQIIRTPSGSGMPNGLYRLAAAGAVLVGSFLLLGAYGHLDAVLPTEGDGVFRLLLPGLILAGIGLINLLSCKWLWDGSRPSLSIALATNALALTYLLYLLARGVPGHPVALFTGIVACYWVLLLAIRFGLVWPVDGARTSAGGAVDS